MEEKQQEKKSKQHNPNCKLLNLKNKSIVNKQIFYFATI